MRTQRHVISKEVGHDMLETFYVCVYIYMFVCFVCVQILTLRIFNAFNVNFYLLNFLKVLSLVSLLPFCGLFFTWPLSFMFFFSICPCLN